MSTRFVSTIGTDEFDHVEKLLRALIPLAGACRAEFVALAGTLARVRDVYAQKAVSDPSTYADLLSVADDVLLRQRSPDEL